MSVFDQQQQSQQTAQQAQTTQQQSMGAGQQQSNAYNPGQYAAQQQMQPLASQIATGNVSSNYGLPQSVADWAYYNFNKNVAPQLANIYGPGSNQEGDQLTALTANLAAQSGQMAVQNANSSLGNLTNYAYNPIGVNQAQMQQSAGTSNVNQQGTSNTQGQSFNYGGLLDLLGNGLFGLGGGFLGGSSPGTPP